MILNRNILYEILGYVYNYDYINKEFINYLLVSKTWYQVLNDIKCQMCLKGIYVSFIKKSIKCNNCWHVLEAKYKKEHRKRLFFSIT
jgi:hypothetical protein